jgi:general secretion pathway protein A
VYEAFYGLREKPFSIIPDPDFLFLSAKHRMALSLLEYGLVNQAGFNVITGEIGTGKTTLIRHLLKQLHQDVTVGLISNTHRSFGELLQWILFAFKLEHRGKSKVEMFQDLLDFLLRQYAENRRTLLIVDEAQNMAPETLEELRMLTNINADKDQVVQVILVGQPGLRDVLRRPDMEQFAQRIAVDYHLQALDREETGRYIRHRINVAGGSDPSLFDDAACDAVHERSRGVPRLINLLCDTALVYGFAEQKRRIDASLLLDAARDKEQGGLFHAPLAPPTLETPGAPAGRNGAGDGGVVRSIEDSPAPVLRLAARTEPNREVATRESAASDAAQLVTLVDRLRAMHPDLYNKLRAEVDLLTRGR